MNKLSYFRDDGILYCKAPKIVDEDFAREWVKQHSKNVTNSNNIRSLTDISELSYTPSREAQKIIVEGIKKLRKPFEHEKNAIVGMNTFLKLTAKLIITLSSRYDIKLFDTEEDAVTWLLTEE